MANDAGYVLSGEDLQRVGGTLRTTEGRRAQTYQRQTAPPIQQPRERIAIGVLDEVLSLDDSAAMKLQRYTTPKTGVVEDAAGDPIDVHGGKVAGSMWIPGGSTVWGISQNNTFLLLAAAGIVLIRFTLTEDLVAGGTAAATTPGGKTISVDDWILDTGYQLPSGRRGFAGWFFEDQKFYVVQAQGCPQEIPEEEECDGGSETWTGDGETWGEPEGECAEGYHSAGEPEGEPTEGVEETLCCLPDCDESCPSETGGAGGTETWTGDGEDWGSPTGTCAEGYESAGPPECEPVDGCTASLNCTEIECDETCPDNGEGECGGFGWVRFTGDGESWSITENNCIGSAIAPAAPGCDPIDGCHARECCLPDCDETCPDESGGAGGTETWTAAAESWGSPSGTCNEGYESAGPPECDPVDGCTASLNCIESEAECDPTCAEVGVCPNGGQIYTGDGSTWTPSGPTTCDEGYSLPGPPTCDPVDGCTTQVCCVPDEHEPCEPGDEVVGPECECCEFGCTLWVWSVGMGGGRWGSLEVCLEGDAVEPARDGAFGGEEVYTCCGGPL